MNILIDMNLTPDWVEVFERKGWKAVHWSMVGTPSASDRTIMNWAQTHNYVVFTHDLDFGTILAVTAADGPSVIQVRTEDTLPLYLEQTIIAAIEQYKELLNTGALIIVDDHKLRARILPLKR
jgi:predicted nuclease of predicted toxin-antitoxin system